MPSRAGPDVPCTALLAREEWQALYGAIHRTPTPPETPPSLRQAVHWIAQLGGFLARRGDGEPGATVVWKGCQPRGSPDYVLYHAPGRPEAQKIWVKISSIPEGML